MTGSAIVLKSDLIVIDLCELVIFPHLFGQTSLSNQPFIIDSSERHTIIHIFYG